MSTQAPSASAPMTSYQRLALTVILIGVLITAVDTTIVVLALPTMMASLKSPLSGAVWVILSYLLVITLLATQVGRIGDMFGRVRIYEYGFLVFIIGSLLCGIAGNETQLILFRILQGIGGAFVTANSGAVIADTFPPEVRGRAYGFNSIGWNLGAILGILLGGFITTYFSWRWIFLINV
ncbi:MAG: MFS transporter, partial [Firmicutes bacterium]|nr:MFS transporter [Bacillota bacterium]